VGAENKIGWAFGLGLDRLVMTQYSIPDIRLLWTEDSRFLDQFAFNDPDTAVVFKVRDVMGSLYSYGKFMSLFLVVLCFEKSRVDASEILYLRPKTLLRFNMTSFVNSLQQEFEEKEATNLILKIAECPAEVASCRSDFQMELVS
jgi:hypothetical protein